MIEVGPGSEMAVLGLIFESCALGRPFEDAEGLQRVRLTLPGRQVYVRFTSGRLLDTTEGPLWRTIDSVCARMPARKGSARRRRVKPEDGVQPSELFT